MHLQTVPKLLMSRLIPDAELNTGAFGIKTPAIKRCWVVASGDVLYTDTSEVSQYGQSYVIKKMMTIPGGYESVVVRVKFNLKTNDVDESAYGEIFKNGVAFGTRRITQSLTYEEYTEDLTFSSGDKVQLCLTCTSLNALAINNEFTVSGREVVSSGNIGQVWGSSSRGDGIGTYLSEDYLSEVNLGDEIEDNLFEDNLSEVNLGGF